MARSWPLGDLGGGMATEKHIDRQGSRAKRPSGTTPSRQPGGSTKPAVHEPTPLIVGIGASAGGLQAFKAFFAGMPADSGMAFVLVQHLDPQHKSMLVELLGSATAMPVIEAAERMTVVADYVYVIPPNATLRIAAGKLRVSKPAPAREHRYPVDAFFSALAEDQKDNAVCIVLSGGGSDGTEGLRAIKEHGGLTMAQAAFDEHAMSGMPMSATSTGLVDHVLAIEEMPAKLIAYSKHLLAIEPRKGSDGTRQDIGEHLARICAQLRGKLGHDFSQYKEKTLVRRIQRRMQVLQIDAMPDYIERMRKDPGECNLLFRELLIGVTHFFRDPPAFEALQTQVMPHLVHNRDADDAVRVWVPACATGEEAYSIAIMLKEAAGERQAGFRFQIFATDIDEQAVAFARAARYRKSQIAELPVARRDRWFAADGDHWCPVKEIREMCIFSTHSVVKDPPFSRLDLISCRNLLIYLGPALQERLVRTFHYALRPGGYLFLGTSESVTRQGQLFATVDQKQRIFQRREGPASLPASSAAADVPAPADRAAMLTENGIEKSARRLMEKHVPAYVVVDGNHDVVRFAGQTDKYLGPTPGAASLNLFSLIRRGLRPAARAALAKAVASRQPVIHEALAIEVNGGRQLVDLVVEALPDSAGLCVVAFLDRREVSGGGAADTRPTLPVEALENELRTMRERLEATVDQLEISNEEMKSANEEYQSVNEELQSTNEELETSKEEMQSINEELQTVNAELNSKNDALVHLNSDLRNLLESTQIATLFLDRQLRIKNFTPTVTDLFHLRDSDRGRPVTDIVSRLSYDGLRKDAMRVMRDLSVVERSVKVQGDGTTFLMRLRPYRTVDDVIDGVVITFVDIDDRTRREEDRAKLAAIVDSSQDAIISKDLDGIITSWNPAAERLFGYEAREIVGRSVATLIPLNRRDEEESILRGIRAGQSIDHFETVRQRKNGSLVEVSLSVSPIRNAKGVVVGASKVARDITERKRAQEELRENEERYRTLFDLGPVAVYSCDASGAIQKFNRRAVELWGREPASGDTDERFCGSFRLFRPDGSFMPHDQCPMAEVVSGKISEVHDAEVLIERPDGSRVTVVVNIRQLKDNHGEITGAINCFYDITERKQSELRQQLLMNELNHRVKNTLATIQSIAARSLRGTSDAASLNAFNARLVALSRTHDLLTRDSWEKVALRDLVRQELDPYRSGEGERFVIEGPDLTVKPKAALALGMAFHELATNAAKYGALSKSTGQVRVAWEVVSASESMLRLEWMESGGPPVEKTGRKGFGSTVIERGLSLELDGEVEIDLKPGGLVCTMELPLAAVGGGINDTQ